MTVQKFDVPENSQLRTARAHGFDQNLANVVVDDLTRRLEIDWAVELKKGEIWYS